MAWFTNMTQWLSLKGADAGASRCPFAPLFSAAGHLPAPRPVAPDAFRSAQRAAGPKGLPVIGSTGDFQEDPLDFLARLSRQYGDVATFRLNFRRYFFLSHPEDIRNYFVRDYANYDKSTLWAKVRQVVGSGLLTCPIADHKRQRRMVQPAFTESSLKTYARVMPGLVRRHVSAWPASGSIDVTSEMDRLTLKIAARTLLGDDLDEQERELEEVIDRFHRQFTPAKMFLASILPSTVFNRVFGFQEIRRTFERISASIFEHGRESGFSEKNVLSSLARAVSEEGRSPAEARRALTDQIINMLLAGQETVATTLNWVFYAMGRNPETAKKHLEEVDRVFQGAEPSYERLDEMTYTESVIKESLRLYPAGWVISRVALTDGIIRGVAIPRGSIVTVSPFVTQRDRRFFEDPLRFDPERWSPEEVSKRPEFSFFPFGGGARGCIGSGYAMMELKLILATVAQAFRLSSLDHREVGFQPLITLRPKDHIRMTVSRRRQRVETTAAAQSK